MSREAKAIVVGFSSDPRYFDEDELEVSVVIKRAELGSVRLDDKVTLVIPDAS